MPRFEYTIKTTGTDIFVDGDTVTIARTDASIDMSLFNFVVATRDKIAHIGRRSDAIHRVCGIHGDSANPAPLLTTTHNHFYFQKGLTADAFNQFINELYNYQSLLIEDARQPSFIGKLLGYQAADPAKQFPLIMSQSEAMLLKQAFNKFYHQYAPQLRIEADTCRRRVQELHCTENFFCNNKELVNRLQKIVWEQAGIVVHVTALAVAFELLERLLNNYTKLTVHQIQHVIVGVQTLLLAAVSPTWTPILLTTGIYTFMQILSYHPTRSTTITNVVMIGSQLVSTTSYYQFTLSLIIALLTGAAVKYVMALLLGNKYPQKIKTD